MGGFLTFILYILIVFGITFLIKKATLSLKPRRILVLAALICAFFAACRGTVGTDSEMYIMAYENSANAVQRWVDFEPGFILVMDILNKMHLSYVSLFFLMNFFTMLFAFISIYSERENINVNIATFMCMIDFYFLSWNIMRQALAISLGIYAMCLFLKGKWKKALFFIIIATTFHFSALICIVVVVGKYLFENQKYKFFVLGIAVVVVFLIINRDILAQLVYLVTGENYYAMYFSRDTMVESNIIIYYLKILPILLIAISGRKNYDKQSKYKVFFAFMILGYVFSSIGVFTDTQVQRIGYYFSYFNWFVVGICTNGNLIVTKGKYLHKKNVSLFIILMLLVMFVFERFYKGYASLVPYFWFM